MRKALLNARIERNLTQEEVAQKAGISRSAYTNIERGVKNPSFDVAVRIQQAVGCQNEDIFSDSSVSYRNTGGGTHMNL